MATSLEAVGDYIVANALGTYLSNGSGTLALGTLPEAPDAVAVVYENAGQSPLFTMGAGGIVMDYSMIQIVCRGSADDYETPRDRIVGIRNLLAGVVDVTSATIKIMRIEPMGNINALGIDAQRRFIFSANFRCLTQN